MNLSREAKMLIRLPLLFLMLMSLDASAAGYGDTYPAAQSAPIAESANDKATCAQKWARYYRSQECFAPYHNVDGTMKPGAFEHCKEYKYPAECPFQGVPQK
jgi:hypothetical protein